MPKVLEFFFDFMSPPSYLAWTQMPALVARTGCELRYRPMFTIGLHDIVGNQSPVMVPNKAKWIGGDLQRYAHEYGVTLKMNPHGLIKILPASRAAALAEQEGVLSQLMDVIYPAMFVHGLNLSEVSVVGELLTDSIDPASSEGTYEPSWMAGSATQLLRRRRRERMRARLTLALGPFHLA